MEALINLFLKTEQLGRKAMIWVNGARKVVIIVLCILASICVFIKNVHAQIIDDVSVTEQAQGYEVVIYFQFPLSYQSHSPAEFGKELNIQLRSTNFQSLTEQEIEFLRQRESASWDYTTGVPLEELVLEGGDPERPQVNLLFTKEVQFEVRSGIDLRSLIITIKTEKQEIPSEQQEVSKPKELEKAIETPQDSEIVLPVDVVPETESMQKLMKDGKNALTDKEYSRAVQIYTKVLLTAEGDVKKQAQEFLGLARERNGQLAHAKAEYEKYLKDYPEGPDAQRVGQRLAGLVTAAKLPKPRFEEIRKPGKIEEKLKKWDTRFYGSLSEFYFRDQTTPQGGETQVNRSALRTDTDFNTRWNNEIYDMRLQFTGSYEFNFIENQKDDDRISNFAFEAKNNENNLYGKVGRQSRTSGGVLGRFDGLHLAYDVLPEVKINTVFGFPVGTSQQIGFDTDKKFFGTSFDLGTFKEHWDFVVFFINQMSHGVTDRTAIGGEVRYFDPKKSFFNLVDYDVFYKTLNIFLFNGRYTFPTKTMVNLILDYRRSPILTTNNALQGQGVINLSDLFDRLSEDEINQLAIDRSGISKSLTLGVTQDLREDIQVTSEITLSEQEATVSSGGIEAVDGTGVDLSYLLQFVITSLFIENDAIITGFRFSDTNTNNTYTATVSGRFPYRRNWRFIPKFRFDYRDEKGTSDHRFTTRPTMQVTYQMKRWLRFEVETGVELRNENSAGAQIYSTETFITSGFRITF